MESKTKYRKVKKFVYDKCQNEITNDSLVQLIELAGSLLNLKTIPDYAKEKKLSYNGVKHIVKDIMLFVNV